LSAPLIRLEGIRKRYPSGDGFVEVLKGISLDIHAGEFVAIMGASGSGKSTLMNILGCLDRPSDGRYYFNGEDVSGFSSDELAWLRREAFGFVFQSYHLIAGCSATQNVEVPAVYAGLAADARQQRARELLTRLGLGERLENRPNQLSGGQQQRVSIARALMNGGHIILADEPTGALDSKSGSEVMELLRELAAAGHTIILITHDREVAENADRIVEFRDGEIISDQRVRSHDTVAALKMPDMRRRNQVSSSRHLLTEAWEAAAMALRSLRANFFRTFLTLLGVMIGVGSVVAMLAIGEGAKSQVLERINSMGTNLLVVQQGGPGSFGRRSEGGSGTGLTLDDVQTLKEVGNVIAVVPENNLAVTARADSKDMSTKVNATSHEYPLLRNWNPVLGTFFSEEDSLRYATVALIGKTVHRELFAEGEVLGKFVMLNNVPFQIIGVMSEQGATAWGEDADDVIFVPLNTANLRLSGQRNLRSITVAAKDTTQMNQTEADIVDLLKARRGSEDFRVRNMASLVETVSATQNTLTVLLGSIAGISLLVGGIGVMNIMLVSVTERTREIGIRMATGARTRNILQQFLIEAVVVSALGGVIGVLAGIGVGLLVNALAMPVQFSVPIMILAFGCAAGTGLIFGFAPALKAARLDPVVALSSE